MRAIAARYCAATSKPLDPTPLCHQLSVGLPPNRQFASVTVWGLAAAMPFEEIERIEDAVSSAGTYPPAIGYMVAEDLPQLLWLAFKTLAFRDSGLSLPDAALMTVPPEWSLLPGHGVNTIGLVHPTAETVASTVTDLLIILAHGRSYEALISNRDEARIMLCSAPDTDLGVGPSCPGNAPRCHLGNACFRDAMWDNHKRFHAGQLRARCVFLDTCHGFRLGATPDVRAGGSLAVSCLNGWATAVVASRYEHEGTPLHCCEALAYWKANCSLGLLLARLSPPGVRLFSLIGDPTQRRLAGLGVGHAGAAATVAGVAVADPRDMILLLTPQAPSPDYYHASAPGTALGAARRLVHVENDDGAAYTAYLLSDARLCGSPLVRLVPAAPVGRMRQRWRPSLMTIEHSRLFAATLLDVTARPGGDPSWDAMFQAHQERYPCAHWTGLVNEDAVAWREDALARTGSCFACGLPLLRRRGVLVLKQEPTLGCRWRSDCCPACAGVYHGPEDGLLTFTAPTQCGPTEPVTVRITAAPPRCIAWVGVFDEEHPYLAEPPPPEARFPSPASFEWIGAPIEIPGPAFRLAGCYSVRIYCWDLATHTVAVASRRVNCVG